MDAFIWILKQVAFLIIGIAVAATFSDVVAVAKFSPVLATLQNISAAVFTLAGIWVAYLYPEAITALANPKKIKLLEGIEATQRIKMLVLTIFTSAFVLIWILMLNTLKPIFESFIFVKEYSYWFKLFYFGFILYLVFNQIWSVLRIMGANIDFIHNLSYRKTEQEIQDKLNK
tara:strand:- start:282 stop:800 length:519 start_codon:yes stop_codon:yes gene_type:complete